MHRNLRSYYTFNTTSDSLEIPIITAIGSGPTLGYHKSKSPATLTLLPDGTKTPGACICPEQPAPFGKASGDIVLVANTSATNA